VSEGIDLRRESARYPVRNELEGRAAHQRDDPWDLVLPGWAGFVAPWGRIGAGAPSGTTLVACTHSVVTTRRLLATVSGARVVQDGSDGQNVTFAVEHLDAVAAVLRLRRVKVVTEAERQRLAGLSRRHSPFRRQGTISEGSREALPEGEGAASRPDPAPEVIQPSQHPSGRPD